MGYLDKKGLDALIRNIKEKVAPLRRVEEIEGKLNGVQNVQEALNKKADADNIFMLTSEYLEEDYILTQEQFIELSNAMSYKTIVVPDKYESKRSYIGGYAESNGNLRYFIACGKDTSSPYATNGISLQICDYFITKSTLRVGIGAILDLNDITKLAGIDSVKTALDNLKTDGVDKLNHRVNLWGQTFDGSRDVGGQIYAKNGLAIPNDGWSGVINEDGNSLIVSESADSMLVGTNFAKVTINPNETYVEGKLYVNNKDVNAALATIPSQASATNQLADKDFVNSSIATNTAVFRGTYTTLSALQSTSADANDYGFIQEKDSDGNTVYNRYKYVEGQGWVFEYALNNSSFTASQWKSIQSGITSADVALLKSFPAVSEIATKSDLALKADMDAAVRTICISTGSPILIQARLGVVSIYPGAGIKLNPQTDSAFSIVVDDEYVATVSALESCSESLKQYANQAISGVESNAQAYTDSKADEINKSLSLKASFSDLSNVIGEEVFDNTTFEPFDKLSREQIERGLFNDRWNMIFDTLGGYKPDEAPDAEHPYQAYDLWLTYEEALAVDEYSPLLVGTGAGPEYTFGFYRKMRTMKPIVYTQGNSFVVIDLNKFHQVECETLNLKQARLKGSTTCTMNKLKSLTLMWFTTAVASINAPLLEEVRFDFGAWGTAYSCTSFGFPNSPKLSLASLQHMTSKSWDKAITITVHPDVFAKLTDPNNAEWYQVLNDAVAKNITFAAA